MIISEICPKPRWHRSSLTPSPVHRRRACLDVPADRDATRASARKTRVQKRQSRHKTVRRPAHFPFQNASGQKERSARSMASSSASARWWLSAHLMNELTARGNLLQLGFAGSGDKGTFAPRCCLRRPFSSGQILPTLVIASISRARYPREIGRLASPFGSGPEHATQGSDSVALPQAPLVSHTEPSVFSSRMGALWAHLHAATSALARGMRDLSSKKQQRTGRRPCSGIRNGVE